MYNKTIIEFGFCYTQNNQGLGKRNQLRPCLFQISQKPHPSIVYRQKCNISTALFNNTRILKLKAQPTNAFFAAVNQVFRGSSQLTTTAELCSLSELCTTI